MITPDEVIHASRQDNVSNDLRSMIDAMIRHGGFNLPNVIAEEAINWLKLYSRAHGIKDVSIGLSGGVDSAVTAALFKRAGYNVHALSLPIHQKPEETQRAIDATDALGVNLEVIDLSDNFDSMSATINRHGDLTPIRQGNIRARLRMITLYDEAARNKGVVASTDNYSELLTGFWTLHGDVGDVAPLQFFNKSFEVPKVGEYLGLSEDIWRATPTDGLGISNSDEDQFGFSYLELDVMAWAISHVIDVPESLDATKKAVIARMAATRHKRTNLAQPSFLSYGSQVYARWSFAKTN